MNIGHSNLKPMSFLNNIKKSKRLSNNYFSLDSTKKISETIDGVQKILKIYEKTRPVIEQSLPTINNIKTTLMVAKAFKGTQQPFNTISQYNGRSCESQNRRE